MARAYKLTDWETLDPLIDQDVAQGMTLKNIATKYGIGKSALIMHRLKHRKVNASPAQEETMTEDVVEILPNQIDRDADTPPPTDELVSGLTTTNDVPPDRLPIIQPFRDLDPLVERALRLSIQRFGVIMPVVKDQYGRILDGHQRSRLAEALGVSYRVQTMEVSDDEEALTIARTLNAERRQLTEEQRRLVAFDLRQEGHSYRAIGAALGVSHVQAMTDVKRAMDEVVSPLTTSDDLESDPSLMDAPVQDSPSVTGTTEPPISHETPARRPRVTGRDKKSYPAQRPTEKKAPKPSTTDEGTTAERWYGRLLREFSQLDRMVEQFQSDGGVSVLGRQLSSGMRDSLLGEMRGKAKMLREMADYLETLTREPTDTNEMFGGV